MEKPFEEMTMEEAYDSLDALLDELESGDHSLEETFALYTKGVQLVRSCHEKIDAIEKKLIVLEEKEEA